MNKRLVFSVPYGLAFRNIVCCGTLAACHRRADQVTVLLPELAREDSAQLLSELPPDTDVRRMPPIKPSIYFTYLKLLKQHLYARRTALDSFQVKHRSRRQQHPLFHHAAVIGERAGELLIPEPTLDRWLAAARQPHEDYYRRLLEDVRADAVVIAKPGYMPEELPLIKAARALRLPTVAVDTTWDNMASKRPPYLRPDALTVWNARMSREAVEYYGFSRATTTVTGGPQFDIFGQRDRLPAREEFFNRLGLDPARPLLLFALNSPAFTPDNQAYVELLVDAIDRNMLKGAPNLVVRLHPWDRTSDYGALGKRDRLRIERPFGVSNSASVYECIPSQREVVHYGALMAYANVVMNIASTTTLDALAAGAPVVNLAFDLKTVPAALSVTRYYDFTHYRAIIDSGAVHLARSPDELFERLNRHLDDPSLNLERREAARVEFLTYADGRNGERIADVINGFC